MADDAGGVDASNDMRRELNQATFKRISVLDQDRAESELQEPVRLLLEAQAEWVASFGVGIDLETNESDAEASLERAEPGEYRRETKGPEVRVGGLWCPRRDSNPQPFP